MSRPDVANPPARSLQVGVVVLWVAIVAAWAGVVAIGTTWFWTDEIDIVVAMEGLGAYVVATVLSLALIAMQCYRRRWAHAGIALLVSVALGVSIFTVNWSGLLIRGYYRLHHGQFTALGAFVREHDLTGCSGPTPVLPARLHSLQSGGEIQATPNADTDSGCTTAWVFVPRHLYLLEGADGYGWFASPPKANDKLSAYDDPISPCISLGDGWYWMERGDSC
jgi:hypothetical protein